MSREIISSICLEKNKLRKKYKQTRAEMNSAIKKDSDIEIFNNLISLECFSYCDTILAYVSTKIEVDTWKLIEYSLNIGKKVAVPKCINGTRDMEFHIINSINDLEQGSFSVFEPRDNCELLSNFDNAVCIVPGLSFDKKGFRLGYGKGYYDRFFEKSLPLIKIGLCYSNCISDNLTIDKFDIPVDILVTEINSHIISS
ncbi:MAG: 5-formyltetrahydrofolate cyclo-ligase [Oscillospiraceae bacterium]